jgi:hypothetical protein
VLRACNYTIHSDGGFRADYSAHCTTCAAVCNQLSRVITLDIYTLRGQAQHMLRTGVNAQLATFAKQVVYFDPSLGGHSFLLE